MTVRGVGPGTGRAARRGAPARRALPALAAGTFLAASAALAQAGAAALFTTDGGGADSTPPMGVAGGPRARDIRRTARVDRASLDGLRAAAASGAPGRLRLNLFRDVEFTASLERSGPTASGFTLSGPLEDVPFGRAVLVVNGGETRGRIYTPGGNYSISTAGGLQTVERMEAVPLDCGVMEPPGVHADPHGGAGAPRIPPGGVAGAKPTVGAAAKSGALSEAGAGDGGVVDVLVMYPSFVREIEGGYAPMLSLIDLDIATANEAYAASGVRLRVRLAAAEEVAYPWLREKMIPNVVFDASDALRHLTGRGDGHLDGVHGLRDRHGADLVLLHLGGDLSQLVHRKLKGGIAWAVHEVTPEALEGLGFSVAHSGNGTFVAHELGHSMGLHHERREGSRNLPFPYSHGFRYQYVPTRSDGSKADPNWLGTVMSTTPAAPPRFEGAVLAFSNPDLVHPDDPDIRLGVPGDEASGAPDGPADAVRHLNELRDVLANVRPRGEGCSYELTGGADAVPAAGGFHRVRVETQPGCGWTARGGRWVASVSPAAGTGSADVEYRVGANDGFRRPVEVLVGGRVHSRPQAGSRPITPVCERSLWIRYALEVSHPDRERTHPVFYEHTPCEELNFDAEYLAGIRTLYRYPGEGERGINGAGARPGDFDGLTGVADLRLHGNERLPADLFFGMTGLRVLEVGAELLWDPDTAVLREVEPGAFRGLPGLKALRIEGHRLERLEPGTFEGLSGLDVLAVVQPRGRFEHRDLALEPGSFRGLHNLLRLTFADTGLNPLDRGVFEGLDNLLVLEVVRIGFESLAPGAFDGLPELRDLALFGNRLASLPTGVFGGLPRLELLQLGHNELTRLQPGHLSGLDSLLALHLSGNKLVAPAPGTFAVLPKLRELYLNRNRLRQLPPNLFDGLGSLEKLWLDRNPIGPLRAGAFAGLSRLRFLYMFDSGITSIAPGSFSGLSDLRALDLRKNRIRKIAQGAFHQLSHEGLQGLLLDRNPGAPFSFSLTPVALPPPDAHGGGLAEFVLEAVPVAPFRMTAELSASGGALADSLIRVEPGESRGHASVVDPEGDGPATVRVDRVRWRGGEAGREPTAGDGTAGLFIRYTERYGYNGFDVAPGPPLTLFGFPDVEASLGGEPRTFDLPWVFSDLPGGADYAASSDDGGVAAARVDGRTLIVSPRGAGTAGVTVTATGSDGEPVVRRFAVTVVDDRPRVPLFLSGSHVGREGFARVVNRTGRSGEVRVTAVDGEGARRGPATLRLAPHGAVNFNSGDLEGGSPGKGLAEGVGFGAGDWRLEFESDLEIDALAYVRTRDGFVTSVHDVAPSSGGVHRIATFNPASNPRQRSRLRVVNRGGTPAAVTVRGVDDAGASPGGPVRFVVPAGGAREFGAAQLESGDAGLEGSLGDGAGKWRLTVESDAPVAAMGLLESASTGHLTNLSSGPVEPDGGGRHHVALFPSASDPLGRQGFVRVVNRSGRAGTVRVWAFDAAGGERGPLTLTVGAGGAAHFNSDDLEFGAAGKGLEGSAGPGEGDWRLSLESGLDIGVLAYVRMADGFLTGVHDVLAVREGRREAVTFNPGSNTGQVSVLRVANPTGRAASVSVVGTDDRGGAPPHRGSAWFEVPAGGTLELDAAELEAGLPDPGLPDPVLSDSWVREPLGNGSGKWRLSVATDPGVLVQSLLRSPTGHLTNLSTDGR